MMAGIVGLTAAYVVATLSLISHFFQVYRSQADAVLIGVLYFSLPMLISYVLAAASKSVETRKYLLIFQIAYCLCSALITWKTYSSVFTASSLFIQLAIALFGLLAVSVANGVGKALEDEER